jgi:hypothetical protein
MKSYTQFISESVNISGNASVGTIIVNGPSEQDVSPIGEQFCADFVWEGNIYRVKFNSDSNRIPTREELSEQIQGQYPGAIVHNIYPFIETNSRYKMEDIKRYHPSKLEWIN